MSSHEHTELTDPLRRRSFLSDNTPGLCPEAVDGLLQANDGSHQAGFGDDRFTAEAVRSFQALFGEDVSVWFVGTGTAANALALASLTEPWQEIICHGYGHHAVSESTTPERLTHCRTRMVDTGSDKLTPAEVTQAAGGRLEGVHRPAAGVVTVANPTEWGTVYNPDEMRALCERAHKLGYRVHVDGTRFANAVAALKCDPRDLTQRAGVDGLSFGGAKMGLAVGDAVLFFPQGTGETYRRAIRAFPHHRKSTGHLIGKQRFVSAPFAAVLRDGIWLKHAVHSNEMAASLAEGFVGSKVTPEFPVVTNQVFTGLPHDLEVHLRAAGHRFLCLGGPGQRTLSRFVCSFDTALEDVASLLQDVRQWTIDAEDRTAAPAAFQ